MTTIGITKSAVSIDFDNAKEHISLWVFEAAVYSRHPLLHSRTTFYQLPWSISPVPTHLDTICSKSLHLPSLSTPLSASGLPTLPLIILSQLYVTSFSFLRSHITRYSSSWSNHPSREDLKVFASANSRLDSVTHFTFTSFTQTQYKTTRNFTTSLAWPQNITSSLLYPFYFTGSSRRLLQHSPRCPSFDEQHHGDYFTSTFFPFFPQRRETNISSRASTQTPSLQHAKTTRQGTPQSCLWVGMPLLMPRCVFCPSFLLLYSLSHFLHLLPLQSPLTRSFFLSSLCVDARTKYWWGLGGGPWWLWGCSERWDADKKNH